MKIDDDLGPQKCFPYKPFGGLANAIQANAHIAIQNVLAQLNLEIFTVGMSSREPKEFSMPNKRNNPWCARHKVAQVGLNFTDNLDVVQIALGLQ